MTRLVDDRPARRSLLAALVCAVLAVIVARSRGGAVVHGPGPVALTLAIAAVAALVRAGLYRASEPRRALADTIAAAARAASALILCAQWASEARELFGAIVVAIVWSDAARGASRARPLAPLAIALVWAIGWSAVRPTDAVPRVAAVAAIAAFGVERLSKSALLDERPEDEARSSPARGE
jgi:hypothetical protein